jgi:nucleoside-diphosphate-sugar epimerase
MRVLVTGGAGFIGSRLVSALLAQGSLKDNNDVEHEITRICVADVGEPPQPLPDDPRIETRWGDFSEPGAAQQLLQRDTRVVFHLAAIVSGQAEQEFDLGMRINLDGTRRLLDACRELPQPPRFLFSSSVAVYGGDMPPVIRDDTPVCPQTSYGSQKAGCEVLINDYSRKGYVDGRALRLPTIVVRPGKPNAAASSFASAVLREPLQGTEVVCPIKADTGVWVLSPRRVVGCFLHAAGLPAQALGMNRTVMLPGITVSVAQMLDALREVASARVAERVKFEPDPFIEKIVYGWPTTFATERATGMGFVADQNMTEIIEAFIEDELGGQYVE